jgi:hypothetical protein
MLFNLSPVQQGTTDSRLIPGTARGTTQVIAQNDIVLNDQIDIFTDEILKPIIEIVFERNLQFKQISDLFEVWSKEDVEKSLNEIGKPSVNDVRMIDLDIEPSVRVLGNMELSNEVAHQAGWNMFITTALKIPSVAKRTKWDTVEQKLLAAYGIKDDSESVFYSDEEMAKIDAMEQKQNAEMANSQNAVMTQQAQIENAKIMSKLQELTGKYQGEMMVNREKNKDDIQAHIIKDTVSTNNEIRQARESQGVSNDRQG